VSFAARHEAGIERDQGLVPAEGGRQRGGEQRAPQAPASAGDVALAFVLSAVIVEWREPGERGGFLAADVAEFRHADDEGEGGALADAGNAQHEIETPGQIVMVAQLLGNAVQLGGTAGFQPDDVGQSDAPQSLISDMLEPGFEAHDVFLDLLDEGEMRRQIRQTRVGWRSRLRDCRLPCEANLKFRQPSGSDEGADDDPATGQPQAAQGGLDPIASGSAAEFRPRQSILLRTN
jgi:hypothetical protein